MPRITRDLILLFSGLALLRIVGNGTYLSYVKPGMKWPLVVTGAVLVALALVSLADVARARLRQPRQAAAAEGPHAGSGPADSDHHGHSHGSTVGWLLFSAAAAVAFLAPPALSAAPAEAVDPQELVRADESGNGATRVDLGPLPARPVPEVSIVDARKRSLLDQDRLLEKTDFTMVGFIDEQSGKREFGGNAVLSRIKIVCCAADARAVSIDLQVPDQIPAPGTWVSVTGQLVPDSALKERRLVPTVVVSTLTEIPAPEQPYIS